MTKTIQTTVNPRLLSKADRLFTGTQQGRIIEVLQNARRAGATEVHITHANGRVHVRDNGTGIEDFQGLLDLGGSGWDESSGLEASEDPAGVGLFSLAPRKVVIRSRGKRIEIVGEGWSGSPVAVDDDPNTDDGTELIFPDACWTKTLVNPLAVFTGMRVTVDREACECKPFIEGTSHHEPKLGCRIRVIDSKQIDTLHRAASVDSNYYDNLFINFHGQVVALSHQEVGEHALTYLVDLTGEPTGIRLMLPARTRLVENKAFVKLKDALEKETYRHLQQRGHHRLSYKQYLRARELGIDLPESEPVYRVGLITDDGYGVEPVEVVMPEGLDLACCYRFGPSQDNDELNGETNTHLLAALGTFVNPFVPVDIRQGYDGYRWADLPRIQKVEVHPGRELSRDWVWNGQLICVDALSIEAHASDGMFFKSDVCMAVVPTRQVDGDLVYIDDEVYITPQARSRLRDMELWRHLGGFSEDGDTWDTQEYEFGKRLDAFWAMLEGPDEPIRRQLLSEAQRLGDDWRTVSIHADGRVVIIQHDGSACTITPPKDPQGDAS